MSWTVPRSVIAVGLLLAPCPTCLAGDSFLDRTAPVQEAVPYGTEIAPPAPRDGETTETTRPADGQRPADDGGATKTEEKP